YAETVVPILENAPWARSLEVEAAIRYSDYDDFGSTSNPKLGLKWKPIDDLLLRASWGTGFRAPNFIEGYTRQVRTARSIIDPCLGSNYASLPGCNGRQATQTSPVAWITTGGNPDLDPEEAETLTVGAVFAPSF